MLQIYVKLLFLALFAHFHRLHRRTNHFVTRLTTQAYSVRVCCWPFALTRRARARQRSADSLGTANRLPVRHIPEWARERSCDIERSQWLYLSVLSGLYIAFESDSPETKTEEAMLDFARCADATASVTVDGYTFNATKSYTETGIFDFPVNEGGLLEELLAGENIDGAVASGIHVMVPPLSPGARTVSWHPGSRSSRA